jgi:Ca2+-binding EF-hand superfamily protein
MVVTSKVVSRDSDDDFARTFNFFHSEKASDKFIDATKFYEICVATGEKMTEGEIRGLIKELDTDGDGRLSFEEFRAAMMEAYAIER